MSTEFSDTFKAALSAGYRMFFRTAQYGIGAFALKFLRHVQVAIEQEQLTVHTMSAGQYEVAPKKWSS